MAILKSVRELMDYYRQAQDNVESNMSATKGMKRFNQSVGPDTWAVNALASNKFDWPALTEDIISLLEMQPDGMNRAQYAKLKELAEEAGKCIDDDKKLSSEYRRLATNYLVWAYTQHAEKNK